MTNPRRRLDVPPRSLIAVPPMFELTAAAQHHVLTRAQLAVVGFDSDSVRNAIRARRWQTVGRSVVVLHNAELSADQRRWVAVLLPGKPAALAGLSAAAHHGLKGFPDDNDRVHILVAHDSSTGQPSWVKVHHSRRFTPDDISPGNGIPTTSISRALVDAAAWSKYPRRACAILCAGVQQRLVRPSELAEELKIAGAIRHRRLLRAVLGDISGGGETLSEIGLGRLAHKAGLGSPRRQRLRRDSRRRVRYVDAEFDLPDGTVLLVEIDGIGHLDVETQADDHVRQNDFSIDGGPMLRFTNLVVRLEPEIVVDQLNRMRLKHS